MTLKNVSRRNDGNVEVKFFNKQKFDILAIYIIPENKVILMECNNINNRSAIVVHTEG